MGTQEQSKYGAVVMLDALGARSLTLEDSLRFLEIRSRFLESLDHKYKELCSVRDQFQEKLGLPAIVTFGDTVVLSWELPKEAPERFLPLLAEWLRPSIMVGLKEGFMFRGAISIGYFVQSGATVIGPAITDAVCWYEMADWFGIVATPSCSHRLSLLAERLTKKQQKLDGWYVEYDVPLKTGRTQKLWVISWPAQYPPVSNTNIEVGPKELFLSYFCEFPVPIGTEQKYSNTISFFDWYCSKIGISVASGKENQE